MPSFDIVSEVDIQELDNAVQQTIKEIQNRFDFRGGKSTLSFDRNQKEIKISADDELKLRSIHQILETKVAKRKIDCRVLNYGPEKPSGNTLQQKVNLKAGIDKEDSKLITKKIKDGKFKVQVQNQDQQIRVTSKKIDELQEVIAMLKSSALPIPLQYVNMRG